ncbi:response regulator [Silvanigrella aquatica]|uniref:Response regulatory domain-containing protein n=1 Tax=Silvanigrella aquatica TaxID=1915309 RepID=A0A1L4CYY3_9BACT|nr:response regulator [Silvanigrella aquatica]APJ03166.1 hypothetical protein AXG55_04305 [Silvanigrella aquatica]
MGHLKGRLVLVVDDEPDLREMLVSELENAQTKTLEAKNGREALQIVKNEKIDLVISDIRMPGGNGIEFLDGAKSLNLKKPVFIFITAFADITKEEIYAHGAEGLITKPFDLPNLLELLEWLSTPPIERYALKPKIEAPKHIKLSQHQNNSTEIIMGRGGALLHTGKEIHEAGSYVHFHITFSNTKELAGIGEVLWNGCANNMGEYCAGVEFRYFTDETRDFGIEILEQSTSKEYVPERKEKLDI